MSAPPNLLYLLYLLYSLYLLYLLVVAVVPVVPVVPVVLVVPVVVVVLVAVVLAVVVLFHNESMHKKSKNIFWTLTIFFDWAIITVQDTTTKDNVNLIARVLPWHVT